jgi:UDP-glucose 4-epimerase
MTAQKTLYITGVAGFLGSHLADHFLAAGHRVLGCDTLIGGYRQNVPEGVGFFESDILDLAAMRQQMKGVDVVVHAAALAYEGLSVFSPRLVTENIVGGSASVFSAVSCGVSRRIVFCSSMARYGANRVPFQEDDTPLPQDPYGIAKVAAEHALINLAAVHGYENAIAVPHNIIGARQKYDDPFRNVASIMVNLMLQVGSRSSTATARSASSATWPALVSRGWPRQACTHDDQRAWTRY